ncbi:hmg box [Pyrenophora seminiperda CCB06]|uniref:Hmg box n=1 Tax=Pyrenophora seminiperda CCB06 TaxID=1302712 RepID=A0A3M7M0C0_9PLEO|nr:hmg box [Pyrenophora seminiperda CCB06]
MTLLASRALSSKDLPPSVESAYYRKCIDLRRRITDIEDSNDGTRLRITRLSRGIQKMRLERAFLLEQLNKHMEYNVDDSDRSSSPPPTPTDKPLRSKRSHNRKGSPPLGGSGSAGGAETERERLGVGQGALEGRMIQHGVGAAMSSAQSTPDPAGRQERSYFGTTIGAGGPVTATSPHAAAVNGVPAQAPPTLPRLHSLPPLQPQQQPATTTTTTRAYFDPAYDEQRPAPASVEEDGARRRAYSGAAQHPPPTTDSAPPPHHPPQNGDTEMMDASFTSVNRG